jgi:hypothetical protein
LPHSRRKYYAIFGQLAFYPDDCQKQSGTCDTRDSHAEELHALTIVLSSCALSRGCASYLPSQGQDPAPMSGA